MKKTCAVDSQNETNCYEMQIKSKYRTASSISWNQLTERKSSIKKKKLHSHTHRLNKVC